MPNNQAYRIIEKYLNERTNDPKYTPYKECLHDIIINYRNDVSFINGSIELCEIKAKSFVDKLLSLFNEIIDDNLTEDLEDIVNYVMAITLSCNNFLKFLEVVVLKNKDKNYHYHNAELEMLCCSGILPNTQRGENTRICNFTNLYHKYKVINKKLNLFNDERLILGDNIEYNNLAPYLFSYCYLNDFDINLFERILHYYVYNENGFKDYITTNNILKQFETTFEEDEEPLVRFLIDKIIKDISERVENRQTIR